MHFLKSVSPNLIVTNGFHNAMKRLLSFFLLGFSLFAAAQDFSFAKSLYTSYEQYKVEGFNVRRINPNEVLRSIAHLRATNPMLFNIQRIGASVEGRPIQMVSFGEGKTNVLLWSQMHGNESTATRALFDVLNYIAQNQSSPEIKGLLNSLKIHVIPMLNPDGAARFQRENALGIDLNRDALRLVSPEAQLLKRMRDSLNADYGFNLHDQSRYYNVSQTSKQASISFLATAYNYEKEMNEKRRDAAQLLGYLNHINELFIPGHTGRYNDDFEPRAFGDNIQLWGTRLLLIETGGFINDVEKELGRKMNFVLITAALESIATQSFEQVDEAVYWNIPENDRKLFDLKVERISVNFNGNYYLLDLGINFNESNELQGFIVNASVEDKGDLSTFYGYTTIDASGQKLVVPKVYRRKIGSYDQFLSLLKQGYGFSSKNRPGQKYAFPLIDTAQSDLEKAYKNATFLIESEGEIKTAIVNGLIYQLHDIQ